MILFSVRFDPFTFFSSCIAAYVLYAGCFWIIHFGSQRMSRFGIEICSKSTLLYCKHSKEPNWLLIAQWWQDWVIAFLISHFPFEICGKRVNKEAGLGLRISVIYNIYGRKMYLERLDHFIYRSETATLSLRRKKGVLSNNDAEKKRNLNQSDKGEEKKRRK